MNELEPMIPLEGGHMNSTSQVIAINSQSTLTDVIVGRFAQVARAAIHFMAAVILAVLLFASWSSSLHAGNAKRPSVAQTVKPASALLDSASLVHLLDSLIIPGLENYRIPGMV